jgi:enterochelin esterase family protein
VPHGAIAEWNYSSKTLNRTRRAHIYTPPGYESGRGEFPVFYLLHGAMDSDASWSTVGRAGLILDNLIAAGKAKPMIVVMPMGHTGPFSFGGGGGGFMEQMKQFRDDFINDLRPQIEQRYRIAEGRQNRAIAGLSMGGAQTLDVMMKSLGDFGYYGVFSSGVFGINGTGFGGNENAPKWEDVNAAVLDNAELKEGLRLVWFATGKEDFLLQTTQETVRVLKSHKFNVIYKETDGGHTWTNWRENYLPEFSQLLFK